MVDAEINIKSVESHMRFYEVKKKCISYIEKHIWYVTLGAWASPFPFEGVKIRLEIAF